MYKTLKFPPKTIATNKITSVKLPGYKIDIQKPAAFLYILQSCGKKKKNTLGINFTKEVKDRDSENYQTPTEEVEDDRHGKISHVRELEELKLPKAPYYPKQSTDSMQSLSKYPRFFQRTRIILKHE